MNRQKEERANKKKRKTIKRQKDKKMNKKKGKHRR